MRRIKPSGKRSFLQCLVHALGTDSHSALPLPPQAETHSGGSVSYARHAFKRTALQKAEQAMANAIMELQRNHLLERSD